MKDAPRKLASAGLLATALNIASNTMGAGLLSVPWTAREAGLAPDLVLLFVVGLMSFISAMVLAKLCDMTGSFSYHQFAELSFGKGRGWIVQVIVACYAMGSCITYVVLLGDFIPEALADLHSHSFLLHRDALIIYACVFYTSLSLLRDLSKLRFTSTAALCCIFYSVILLISRATSHATKPISNRLSMGIFDAVPIINVAWCFHYNVCQYYLELRNRTLPRFAIALTAAFSMCAVVYVATMVSGYLAFGSTTNGNVIKSFPDSYKPALVARGLLSVTVTSVFPQAFHAVRNSVYLVGGGVVRQFEDRVGATLAYVFITLSFSAVATVIGILVPKVEVVLGYKGSLFGSCILFILPGTMFFVLSSRQATLAASESRTQSNSLASDLTDLEESLLQRMRVKPTSLPTSSSHPSSSMETIPLGSATSGLVAPPSSLALDSTVRSQPFLSTLCSGPGLLSAGLVIFGVVSLVLGTLKTAKVHF